MTRVGATYGGNRLRRPPDVRRLSKSSGNIIGLDHFWQQLCVILNIGNE